MSTYVGILIGLHYKIQLYFTNWDVKYSRYKEILSKDNIENKQINNLISIKKTIHII